MSVFSLADYKAGFGGKFGVQTDRVDKSALGWEHHEKVDKHESQKGINFDIVSIYIYIYIYLKNKSLFKIYIVVLSVSSLSRFISKYLSSIFIHCNMSSFFSFICCLVQITKQASEESLVCRVIARTKALTAGSTTRRLTSMSPRKVGSHLYCVLFISLSFYIFLTFVQIIRQALGETMEYKQTELTSLLLVGSTMNK